MGSLNAAVEPMLADEDVLGCALVDRKHDRRSLIPLAFVAVVMAMAYALADFAGVIVVGFIAGAVAAWLHKRISAPGSPRADLATGRSIVSVTPTALIFLGVRPPTLELTGFSTDIARHDVAAVHLGRSRLGLDSMQVFFVDGEMVQWTFVRKPSGPFISSIRDRYASR